MARRKKPDLLAQDAAAAKAAGMTYGRWRLTQDKRIPDEKEQESPSEESAPSPLKVCPCCGRQFRPNRNQRYCDYLCQRQAKADQKKSEGRP